MMWLLLTKSKLLWWIRSVNNGISKETYLGKTIDLAYPTVDHLASVLQQFGPGCHIFKKDLKRAYREFHLDPKDINFSGYVWQDKIYLDLVLVMGARSAAYLCQRVTDAPSYMANQAGIVAINYLDDICCVSDIVSSANKYHVFSELLSRLGLQEATSKAVAPSTTVEFLGIQITGDFWINWFVAHKGAGVKTRITVSSGQIVIRLKMCF